MFIFGNKALKQAIKYMKKNGTESVLDLSHAGMNDSDVKKLIKFLKPYIESGESRINTIDLTDNKISVFGLYMLTELINLKNCVITVMKVVENDFEDGDYIKNLNKSLSEKQQTLIQIMGHIANNDLSALRKVKKELGNEAFLGYLNHHQVTWESDYKSYSPSDLASREANKETIEWMRDNGCSNSKEMPERAIKSDKFKEMLESAIKGDKVAQNNLALEYEYGDEVEQDYEEAVKWYRKSAEQGYADAQNNLGDMYASGQGVKQDYEEAVKWYRKSAEQGDPDAQNNLGYAYQYGRGVPKSYKKALEWFHKSAEQGHADAQNNLGELYSSRNFGQPDYKEAVKWYRKSAEQDDPNSQNTLGHLYENGLGVPQDNSEAIKWYTKAAKQGYDTAQSNLAYIYAHGEGIEQNDQKIAFEWRQKAAKLGHIRSQYMLGVMYENGQGTPKNEKKALRFYLQAAEPQGEGKLGYAAAQYKLGLIYEEGKGVVKNYQESFKWYLRAAERGLSAAQDKVSKMYASGTGVSQNNKKSIKFQFKSLEPVDENVLTSYYNFEPESENILLELQDNASKHELFDIGDSFYNGKNGLLKNLEKALQYYTLAADKGHYLAKLKVQDCKTLNEYNHKDTEGKLKEEELKLNEEEIQPVNRDDKKRKPMLFSPKNKQRSGATNSSAQLSMAGSSMRKPSRNKVAKAVEKLLDLAYPLHDADKEEIEYRTGVLKSIEPYRLKKNPDEKGKSILENIKSDLEELLDEDGVKYDKSYKLVS